MIRRDNGQLLPRKELPRNLFKPIQAFAQARADSLRVQTECTADFFIAEVSEITQINDFPARPVEVIESLMDQTDAFPVH